MHEDAGNPTLGAVANAVKKQRGGAACGITINRLSAWRTGANLPDETQLAQLLVPLFDLAKTRDPAFTTTERYQHDYWRRLLTLAKSKDAHRDGEGDPPEPARDQRVPYPGLAAYRAEDSIFFHGRAKITTKLVERVRQAARTGGLIVLSGYSGSGKSSLIAAGLLPALASGSLPGSATWPAVVITPGEDALQALRAAIPELDRELDELTAPTHADQLTARVRAAVSAFLARTAGAGARLLLVVDQAEELWTLCKDDARRDEFVAVLDALATASSGEPTPSPAIVLLAIRADFAGRLGDYPPLGEAYEHRQLLVSPMGREELRAAIVEPARTVGMIVNHDLVDELLDAICGKSGGPGTSELLPLMASALFQTYTRCRDGGRWKLTLADYRKVGGIAQAIATAADATWDRLDPHEETAAWSLLLQMTRVGTDTQEDTRHRRGKRQLIEQSPDRAAAEHALDVLVEGRLVALDDIYAQIAHEALLREWPRFKRRIDSARESHRRRQELEEAADKWDEDRRHPSMLFAGPRLARFEEWRTDYSGPPLHQHVTEFLDESVRRRDEAIYHDRRSRTRSRVLNVALAVLSVVALAAVAALSVANARGDHERDNAIFTQVVAEADRLRTTDPSLAVQLYLTAYRMRATDDLYTALLDTENQPLSTPLPGHVGIVRASALSADGRMLASAGDDGTVVLDDLTNPTRPRLLGRVTEAGPIDAVALTRDGQTLITAGAAGSLRVWNVTAAGHPVPLSAPVPVGAGTVWGVALSPDGKTLATAGADGTARLWNVTDLTHPMPLSAPLPGGARMLYGSGLAFSPDGKTLATAGADGTARLWNVTDLTHPMPLGAPLPGGARVLYTVAFSPDGHTLVTGGGDNVMRVWNLADHGHPTLLDQPQTAPTSSILAVAVSPDGETIASANADNTVTLWNSVDLAHLRPLGQPLTGHTRGVGVVTFSPNGRTLITGSADSAVRVWSLPLTRLLGPTGDVTSVVLSHNGRTLAVASADGTVRLWDITNRADPIPLGEPLRQGGGFLNAVAFSPDDRVLASGGDGRTVQLWDVSNPALTRPLGAALTVPGEVGSVAFSPNGRTLAIGCGDGTVRLVEVTEPEHPVPLPTPLINTPGKLVGAVRFSPDGTVLASAGADGAVWLWKVAEPDHPGPLAGPLKRHTDRIFQLAFSPDGKTLTSASADHSVRFWNVTNPARAAELGEPLQQGNAVGGLAYSSDGTTVAAGSDDQKVWLWKAADPERPTAIGQPLIGHTDYIYTVGFGPDGTTLASGGRDRTVLLWQLNADFAIRRICAATPNNLTPRAWTTLVSPALPYHPPCS